MTNKVEEGYCLQCGLPLIELNDWSVHEGCIEAFRARVLKAKKNTGERSPKKITIFSPHSTKWLRDKKK